MKLFLLFAIVVTFAGGFVFWRAWDRAALPTEEDVARFLYGEGHTQVSVFAWPEDQEFVRVGEWDLSVGYGKEGVDRIAFMTFAGDKGFPVSARPATEMARLRARYDPDCSPYKLIEIDPTQSVYVPGPNPNRATNRLRR